jgi:ribosomal-protein-alanine N-acetyltransferase
MRPIPELEVGRWRLRALQHADAEPWLAIIRDPELRRLTSWDVDTIDAMRRLVADYIEGPRADTTRRWAIIDVQGAFSGTCGFKDWDREAESAELTYELAPEHRGQGTMSAIAAAVLAHGIAEMNLETVRALVMVENQASNRLLKKLGFERTATLPSFRTCGGVLRDYYSYEYISAASRRPAHTS